ncbi:MAG: phosphotransferase family protein, partial [Myxococcota bacterium]
MSDRTIDSPRDVREGEELDLAAVAGFLSPHTSAPLGSLAAHQFPGGHSNLTYMLTAGDTEFVLRRPPFGAKIKSGHDMGREFRVLSGLAKVNGPAPKPIAYCDDESVLGAPFYVMERVRGIIPRKPKLLASLDADAIRTLSTSTVDTLAAIHGTDLQASGFDSLGKPEGYVERQVNGWNERYAKAKTDEVGDMESVGTWLTEN